MLDFPEEIGECRDLEEIEATDNYIESLPATLSKLSRLKSLVLDKNRISSVPSEILMHCISLQTLSLHDNPISIDVIN